MTERELELCDHDQSSISMAALFPCEVRDSAPLLWAIRDEIGLTGTKFGCGIGLCGACTVHVNGRATRSCITPVGAVHRGQGDDDRGAGPGRPASAANRLDRIHRCNAATANRDRSCRPPPY